MGYCLDIVFPPKTENGNLILELACEEAGFERDENERNSWYLPSGYISILEKESEKYPGDWAYIRLSWATEAKTYAKLLVLLVKLGQKYGFRVYDGQIKKFVEKENFAEGARALRYGLAMVSAMFGMCRRKKTVPDFPGDIDFMGPLHSGDPLLGRFPILGGPIPANADEMRGRLQDTIVDNDLDLAGVAETKIPQNIKSFLIQAGITTVEQLLMSTPEDIEQMEPADKNPGRAGIEAIQKYFRDMTGLWRFDDFDDRQLRIRKDVP